jgi:hypothetical protein
VSALRTPPAPPKLRSLLCALALSAALGAGARAQEAAKPEAGSDTSQKAADTSPPPTSEQQSEKARPKAGAPARKVLRLDEFAVEGRIQKPQAFFILQRSNLNYDDGEKKETFLPKIVKSTDKDPF